MFLNALLCLSNEHQVKGKKVTQKVTHSKAKYKYTSLVYLQQF